MLECMDLGTDCKYLISHWYCILPSKTALNTLSYAQIWPKITFYLHECSYRVFWQFLEVATHKRVIIKKLYTVHSNDLQITLSFLELRSFTITNCYNKRQKTAIFSLFELYLIQFETKLNKLIFQDPPKLPFPTLLNLF